MLRKYKNWSSIIFTDNGLSFSELEAKVNLSFANSIVEIDRFNYRTDSTQIVAYNSFYNTQFPRVNEVELDSLYIKYLIDNSLNTIAGDETEDQAF